MEQNLLTAGEFAKLARTTKRTVLWYAEKGILKPYKIDSSNYRWYAPEQIIDFQGLLLMRKLGFSIADIQQYLVKGQSLQQLFKAKRTQIKQQLAVLERSLAETESYYKNLATTNTLVEPYVKKQSSFEIYYIDRQGSYAKIKEYIYELRDMFTSLPGDATFLTIFVDSEYNPKNATMKIGVVRRSHVVPKPGALLLKLAIPSYKALCHRHVGSPELLSLLWRELEKYRVKKELAIDTSLPFADLEFYNPGPDGQFTTELQLPINRT